jgi:tetratricopeptide (TPR) repeat protein
MKSIFFSFFLLGTLTGLAQSEKYIAAMEKNLHMFDTAAKTTADYLTLANNFERIGDAEKTQWLPYYYAGLALANAGWADPALEKDANSTRINTFCDKAEALDKNSEIYVLRNMSATQQMLVDPQTRYMTYGVKAKDYLDIAIKLNPDNPRIYYLQGESLFGTPAAFGGGKDKAKPLFEKALALYKVDKPKPMWPNWGKERTEEQLAKCQ